VFEKAWGQEIAEQLMRKKSSPHWTCMLAACLIMRDILYSVKVLCAAEFSRAKD
jgi:hypothetical protein